MKRKGKANVEKVKRKKWTESEIKRLVALSEKYTKSEIAKKLHRTPSSVGFKLWKLGIGGLASRTEKWNFRQIAEDQSFYISEEGTLVICFNEGDVAPMYMGCVKFEMPKTVWKE